MKKQKQPARTCSECIHEWACQAWTAGTIHNMDATNCKIYETVEMSTAYYLGCMDTKRKYEEAGK